MDQINDLIVHLIAIGSHAKDIHYNCWGDDFYGKHLFADRIQENLNEYIDQLKEVCLRGHAYEPLDSKEYLRKAIPLIPNSKNDFLDMQKLLLDTLQLIEDIDGLSKGDDNLLGAIAQDLQNSVGLINIMYGE